MVYYASDIIRKAEMAADLQNSDFLSWFEKTSLLNDAYISLYQKLINTSDMSFVKRVQLQGDCCQLPEDFWQVKNIFLDQGMGTVTNVLRRAPSGSFYELSYEILNNELHIYGSRFGSVILEYYKKPVDLTFKPDIYPVSDCLTGANYLASYGNYILYSSTSDKEYYYLLNFADNSQKTVELENIQKAYCGKNGFIVCTPTETKFLSYDLSLEKDLGTSKPVYLYDSTLGSVNIETGEILVGNIPVGIMKRFDKANPLDMYSVDVSLDNYTGIKSGLLRYNGKVVSPGIFALDTRYFNGKFWALTDSEIIYVNDEENVCVKDQLTGGICFRGFNENSGYGILAKDNEELYLSPFVDDTYLDFPNTFYFQLLSLMLALQFKIKQGADATGIKAQLDQYEQTFYDTLTRDSYNFTRVTNVY